MAEIYGQAIKITPENREAIAIVNHGIIPHESVLELDKPSYFITPYDPNGFNEIFGEDLFNDFYEFVEDEDPSCFVDVVARVLII